MSEYTKGELKIDSRRQVLVFAANNKIFAECTSEGLGLDAAKANAKELVRRWNLLKQPKCKTCDDSKEIIKEDPDVLPVNWTIPCPDCQQPKDQPSSEFTKKVKRCIGDVKKIPPEAKVLTDMIFNLCDRLDTSEASRKELWEACEYTKTLLSKGIGQHTHALALIEAATKKK